MTPLDGLAWANRFASLGPDFFTELPAQGLPDPHWVARSPACAEMLGWPAEWPQWPTALDVFAGNAAWPGMRPLAGVYSGHQFGVWAGQLGDGRALWLGEVDSPAGPQELQIKGGGLTPYSRRGDGRAVLRSSIREFLCSEAMAALGVPTTRALCITGSRLPVIRESVETAAIVTRVAPSFVRFGHFEHFAHHQQLDALRRLTDWFIAHHAPECADAPEPAVALLRKVALQTADLIAHWQAVGFCHGVMNTDNMSILGVTIDYGPFGFVDAFDANHICNHSDTSGRYAYRMQPRIAHWNCYCLAQALLPLIGLQHGIADDDARAERAVDDAQAVLAKFPERFGPALERAMRAKLGLELERENDAELANKLLETMHASHADFTLTFRRLAQLSKHDASRDAPVRDLFIDRDAFDAWANLYRARLSEETRDDAARAAAMNRANPKYVLRNHLAEVAIRRAKEKDFSEVERLAQVLRRPFDEQPEYEAYAALPPDWAGSLEVSCSS